MGAKHLLATSRTARQARLGVRIPARRASGWTQLTIVADTRERYPYRFAHQDAVVEKRALPIGDYGVELDGQLVAAVQRKSLADLARRLLDGDLGFVLAELAAVPRAAGGLLRRGVQARARPARLLADLLARVQVRYPSVTIVFCGARKLAEEWTFRFLGAALAELAGEERFGDPCAASCEHLYFKRERAAISPGT